MSDSLTIGVEVMMRGENRDLTETGLIKGDVSCSTHSSSSEETFDLEADVQYQYLKETSYGLQHDISTFEGRKLQLEKICQKFKDPFR